MDEEDSGLFLSLIFIIYILDWVAEMDRIRGFGGCRAEKLFGVTASRE